MQNQIGYDGIWEFPDGHTVIIEAKITDIYQIDLSKIAKYRHKLIKEDQIKSENSSILIIIGREDRDTSGLEAQIRGSRFAWDIRLISVDSLVRLMFLKEEVDDPNIVRRISSILIPKEFTKLDGIINIVFSTAEDIREEKTIEIDREIDDEVSSVIIEPVSFNENCIRRIENVLKKSLLKRTRTIYSTSDESIGVSCAVSKKFKKSNYDRFWFAFHPYQQEFLKNVKQGYVAFGCDSPELLVFIPLGDFESWLNGMNITTDKNRFYWHVIIRREKDNIFLVRKKGSPRINLNHYLVNIQN